MFINNYARRILLVLVKIVKSRLDLRLHDVTQTGFSNTFPAVTKNLVYGYVLRLVRTPKKFCPYKPFQHILKTHLEYYVLSWSLYLSVFDTDKNPVPCGDTFCYLIYNFSNWKQRKCNFYFFLYLYLDYKLILWYIRTIYQICITRPANAEENENLNTLKA